MQGLVVSADSRWLKTLNVPPTCLSSNIRCFRVDPSPSAPSATERHGGPAVWSHGYTEASGVKTKSVLKRPLTPSGFSLDSQDVLARVVLLEFGPALLFMSIVSDLGPF